MRAEWIFDDRHFTQSTTIMKTLDRDASRRLDRRAVEEFGVPSIVLMENAGRGVVDTLYQLGVTSPVAICCGGGNNGGDGLVIARHLQLRGIESRVLLWADPEKITGDARINLEVLRRSEIPVEVFQTENDVERFDARLDGRGLDRRCSAGNRRAGRAAIAIGSSNRTNKRQSGQKTGRRRAERLGLRHRPSRRTGR